MLVEVSKESVFDCIRRPIRLFMRKTDSTGAAGQEGKGESKDTIRQLGNPNKEPVAEAMTRKNFYTFMNAIKSTATVEEVSCCV